MLSRLAVEMEEMPRAYEKFSIQTWVENIDIIGEDRDKTIITYDDHANINKMGTFRTFRQRGVR